MTSSSSIPGAGTRESEDHQDLACQIYSDAVKKIASDRLRDGKFRRAWGVEHRAAIGAVYEAGLAATPVSLSGGEEKGQDEPLTGPGYSSETTPSGRGASREYPSRGRGWRADCFRTRMEEFDTAYKKACASSQPQDWMDAALLAQQFRNVAYAVLTGEAPRQEAPASVGWVLVPREPTDAMVQAGGEALPPTHRLTDCFDYFREAWEQAISARPLSQGIEAEGRDAERLGASHESPSALGGAPQPLPLLSEQKHREGRE